VPVGALLAVQAAIALLGGAAATAAAAPDTRATLSLDLGVPIPIAVYGYMSRGDGGDGGELVFLGAASLALSLPLDGALSCVVWGEVADIHGRDGDASADIYFASLGVGLELTYRFGSAHTGPILTGSVGPSVLASGIVVDDDMRLDTWSLGARARLNLGVHVASSVALGLAVAFGLYVAPLDEGSWFNRSLGGTRFAVIGVSVAAEL
jgi:hypothetical protein